MDDRFSRSGRAGRRFARRLIVALLTCALVAVPPAAGADAGAWTLMPLDATTVVPLRDVSAASPSAVFAAGDENGHAALARYDGEAWQESYVFRKVPSSFSAVAAPSAGRAWAVGTVNLPNFAARGLVYHYSGGTWSRVRVPERPVAETYLNDVAAAGDTNVWLAGETRGDATSLWTTLIEHWNGRRWHITTTPNPSENGFNTLGAVSATPNGRHVLAVGEYGDATARSAMFLRRTRAGWRSVWLPRFARRAELLDVLALGQHDVWIAGWRDGAGGQRAFACHWDGSRVSFVRVAQPAGSSNNAAFHLAADGNGGVYLAGWVSTTAAVWKLSDAGVFRPMALPAISGTSMLESISATGDTLFAVGGHQDPGELSRPFVLRYSP